MNDEQYREIGPMYRCSCKRNRFHLLFRTLRDSTEQGLVAEIECHYCGKKHFVSVEDFVFRIVKENPPTLLKLVEDPTDSWIERR